MCLLSHGSQVRGLDGVSAVRLEVGYSSVG